MADQLQNLNREHEDVLHNYGVEVSELPVKLRSKYKNIESLISELEADPNNEEKFSKVQGKITVFSDELQKYFEKEAETEE